ncbi:hypothetical protein [Puia sp.]|uniref:hypothetical protein n=1 Tax=Puia sp. TaxID=2045100 RepID=UPI002F3E1F4F
MNKLIGTLLAGAFVLAQHGVQAQVSDHATLLNTHAMGTESAATKASRDFLQRAGDQKNEQWYKESVGYEAEFTDGPVKASYRYDKKGNWLFSILTYGEKNMPEAVRRLVRSTWYDFNIGWVKELHEAQSVVYVVYIDNAKAWKEVAVQDGETRVLKEFCK